MSAMTDGGRRGLAVIERLLDALADPARRERTVVAVLLAYVALWTLYAVLAKGSQDIHADMSEQFALARELALGYPKHPPLAMLVVRAWFTVFPAADWAYYLLAMANVGLTLWIVWRLVGALSRRRKARRRTGFAYFGAVLQFSRPQVQRQHGADAAMGGDDAVVPALVRDPAPARRRARRARGRGGNVRQILVGVPAARARRRRARRSAPRRLFPLPGAVGDDRGRRAGARAARGSGWSPTISRRSRTPWSCTARARSFPPWAACWAISPAASAYVAVPLHHRARRRAARARAAVRDMAWPASPERRLAAAGVLGGAAGAGAGRALHRRAPGIALVDVGVDAAAGHAAVLAARDDQPPRRRWVS